MGEPHEPSVGLVYDDVPTLAVVVEVQLGRDPAKRWSWPVYLTTLRARLRCPTALLVLCPDPMIADWCGTPIDLGHPGWTLRPLVAGLSTIDDQHLTRYHDVVLAALPAAARRYLEELMTAGTYEYQSDFVRRYVHQGRAEGEAQGEAKGEAKAVLVFLAARGIDVPDEARDRITSCADLDQLEIWIRRAATITTVDELFT